MANKLFELLGSNTVFSLFCGVGNMTMKIGNVEIVDIVREGSNLRVYFGEDNYLYINPEEYIQHESSSGKYVKSNGDYFLFIDEEEVELC